MKEGIHATVVSQVIFLAFLIINNVKESSFILQQAQVLEEKLRDSQIKLHEAKALMENIKKRKNDLRKHSPNVALFNKLTRSYNTFLCRRS